jgi:hypothetical protein
MVVTRPKRGMVTALPPEMNGEAAGESPSSGGQKDLRRGRRPALGNNRHLL